MQFVSVLLYLFFFRTAFADCLPDNTCAPNVCCSPAGDCCWTNDPLLMIAIALTPIIVFLIFFFPIRIAMMKKAIQSHEYSDSDGRKAIIWGVIASILTLLLMQLSVHKCLFPKGKYLTDTPTAQITVTQETVNPPHEETNLSGITSFVENDSTIECYEWELLTKPEGSKNNLSQVREKDIAFKPDLFGDYKLQLTVQNSYGIKNTTETVIHAIPQQELWIEMFWKIPKDDMDLHVLRGGKPWNDAKGKDEFDCGYGNCIGGEHNVDWGIKGDINDNPRLDLDDLPNTGPENINIMTPATETLVIGVHDHTSHTYLGSNAVTIRVYFKQQLVWTGTKDVTGEDIFVPFATIDTQTGIVSPL